MNLTIARILVAVLAMAALPGWAAEPARSPYRNRSQTLDRRVEDLPGRITLEEKVWQMNMPCGWMVASGTRERTTRLREA